MLVSVEIWLNECCNQSYQIARKLNFGMQQHFGPLFENFGKKYFTRKWSRVKQFFAKRAYFKSNEWIENLHMALILIGKHIFT